MTVRFFRARCRQSGQATLGLLLLGLALAIGLIASAAVVSRSLERIKLAGEIWSARAYDGQSVFEPGTRVQVLQIEGATALVAW